MSDENNQPFFNIRLKDDKHYPYLKVDLADPWPRVYITRRVEKDGAHFGRIAAKVPARRIPEVVDRLIALYGKERRAGEAAAAFFRRVDADQVSRLLGDLEKITAEDAVAEDFVDLAEEHEFVVETMGGECSA